MNVCRTCGQTEKPTSIVKISNYIVDNGNQIRISDLLFMLTSLKVIFLNRNRKNKINTIFFLAYRESKFSYKYLLDLCATANTNFMFYKQM